MTYRLLLETLIHEAKSEAARAKILSLFGSDISKKLDSLDDIVAKRFRNNSEAFLSWIEVIDPTRNSIYVNWIIRRFLAGDFRFAEDIGKMTNLLDRYEEIKPKVPVEQRDINGFKSVSDFHDYIESQSGVDARSESQKDRETEKAFFDRGEAVLHYDSPEIKIVIPKTKEAAQWFGRNTRWCTSAKSNNMFDQYNKNDPLYIILFKKTNTRWQFHFETDQFMNEIDENLSFEQVKSIVHLFDVPVEKEPILIQYIDNPSEELQLVAVRKYAASVRYIKNPSKAVQLAAVKNTPFAIKCIDDPCEEAQIAAVQKRSDIIQHIDKPSEVVQLAAVERQGWVIQCINNPSEAVQLAAVLENGHAICNIANPSEMVQLAAVRTSPASIQHIDNPSEAVKKAAREQRERALKSNKNN